MSNFTIKYKATFITEVSVDAPTYEDAVRKVIAMDLHNFLYSADGLNNPDWWDVEEYDEDDEITADILAYDEHFNSKHNEWLASEERKYNRIMNKDGE
jgi:hypothetical protein